MQPALRLLGSTHSLIRAQRIGEYVDAGAACSDDFDGDLSANVTVDVFGTDGSTLITGLEQVRLPLNQTAGLGVTFRLTYHCVNSAGLASPTIHRSVLIRDAGCPSCPAADAHYLSQKIKVEASFPYSAPLSLDVKCEDDLDGSLAPGSAFLVVPNHSESESLVNVEQTGEYSLTYILKDASGNWNYGVGNTQGSTCYGAHTYIRTVKVVDTLQPVLLLRTGREYFNDENRRLRRDTIMIDATHTLAPVQKKPNAQSFTDTGMLLITLLFVFAILGLVVGSPLKRAISHYGTIFRKRKRIHVDTAKSHDSDLCSLRIHG